MFTLTSKVWSRNKFSFISMGLLSTSNIVLEDHQNKISQRYSFMKQNETKQNETKQNETKQNETKRNETKRNETK